MNPELFNFLTQFKFEQKAVLCSILYSAGSVPRKDYPLMLVLEDGSTLGTVGGGALENRAVTASLNVLKTSQPELLSFTMSGTDISADQSVCGGSATLLAEQFTPELQKHFSNLPLFSESSAPGLMISGYEPGVTGHVFHFVLTRADLQLLPDYLRDQAKSVFQNHRSLSYRETERVYLLRYYSAKPVLHIFGAGHVGSAVADLANFLDIPVKIYDDRVERANPERFPFARSISTNSIDKLMQEVRFEAEDFAVVTTRNHKSDLEILFWLLGRNLRYIGLMSSRRKWKMIAEALRQEGVSQNLIDSVFAPVGLDLGEDTVPEIALSIMGQVLQELKKQDHSKSSPGDH